MIIQETRTDELGEIICIDLVEKTDRIIIEWDGKTFIIQPFTDMSLSIKPYGFTESIDCSSHPTKNPINTCEVIIR